MPSPIDVYRITADPSLDPAGKQAALDMLYSGGPAAPEPLPDASTASNEVMESADGSLVDANTPAPPVAPPSAMDAGGMSGAPNMTPVPAMSTPDPVPSEASPAPPLPQAPGLTQDQATSRIIANAIGQEAQGSPGRRVAAHDQKLFTESQHMAPVPDEIKDRIESSQQAEQGLALAEGDRAAAAKLGEAEKLDEQAFSEHAQQNAFRERQRMAAESIAQKEAEFKQAVEDSKQKPGDWWNTKTTGQKGLTLLAALMFGLARDTTGMDKLIEADAAARSTNRDKKLSAMRSRIDSLKAQMLSPEAASQVDRAMGYHVMATEADRLAAQAKAPEIKANAEAVVQHLQTQAAQAQADAWRLEHGAEMTKVAHVPDQVVGGRAPDLFRGVKKAKDAGFDTEGAIRTLTGGNYSEGQGDDPKRRVIFSDGTVGYTGSDSAKDPTQDALQGITTMKRNLAQIKEKMRSPGHTLAGKEKAELETLIADTNVSAVSMVKGGGVNARLGEQTQQLLAPLIGSAALSSGTTDASALASVNQALRQVDAHENEFKNVLTRSANTKPKDGKIETLGSGDTAAAEEHGFKPKD